MSWSKVKKPFDKSLKWWYNKILCEIGYWIYQHGKSEGVTLFGLKIYHKRLNKLYNEGFNLYGEARSKKPITYRIK